MPATHHHSLCAVPLDANLHFLTSLGLLPHNDVEGIDVFKLALNVAGARQSRPEKSIGRRVGSHSNSLGNHIIGILEGQLTLGSFEPKLR